MTLDAVGGVWRYAVDLAQGLAGRGVACLLVGVGPRGAPASVEGLELVWTGETLDWMAGDESELRGVADTLSGLAREWRADLLHLNLPSQAAGLPDELAVLVASHSCVPSWWEAMRGTDLPASWAWLQRRNRRGFDRADAVLAPSASHAAALARIYGEIPRLRVVHNAGAGVPSDPDTLRQARRPFVLAAGRWWDEGKNAAVLDRAAHGAPWPVVMAGPLASPHGDAIELHHARAAGVLPAPELQALMREAAIFVAPSRYEPFGLAVLEAASCRAALVLADIPTFRELWEDAALFVPSHDADGFREAIAALAADPQRRRQLGADAARRAATLSPGRHLDGVLAAYASAMAGAL